ncbi:MAG: DUF2200 domain-containing protein [Sphaerochaetaceae bacterium]|nr:DUF2200 domain-containing protein [Sphaerochaetaceae bacterium]
MSTHRIYSMSFSQVYPLYIAKSGKKGRTKAEVDEIIRWLFGYTQEELESHIARNTSFEKFITECPHPHPVRLNIKKVVCGIRPEDIEDPVLREIRYLDKLIDELAKGKAIQNILRA